MEVYPKISGTRFSSVGAQPSERSCAESPWGQGSYRPTGFAGFRFSWLVVAASHGGLSAKMYSHGLNTDLVNIFVIFSLLRSNSQIREKMDILPV
jgi:hypothetical protein